MTTISSTAVRMIIFFESHHECDQFLGPFFAKGVDPQTILEERRQRPLEEDREDHYGGKHLKRAIPVKVKEVWVHDGLKSREEGTKMTLGQPSPRFNRVGPALLHALAGVKRGRVCPTRIDTVVGGVLNQEGQL